MPKSETLPLRRWPCWPGPYSRRLTGLLGRPKTFSPMRRSSLYLALVRFVTLLLQFAFQMCPGPHRWTSNVQRDRRFTGHAGSIASGAPRAPPREGQVELEPLARRCADAARGRGRGRCVKHAGVVRRALGAWNGRSVAVVADALPHPRAAGLDIFADLLLLLVDDDRRSLSRRLSKHKCRNEHKRHKTLPELKITLANRTLFQSWRGFNQSSHAPRRIDERHPVSAE